MFYVVSDQHMLKLKTSLYLTQHCLLALVCTILLFNIIKPPLNQITIDIN